MHPGGFLPRFGARLRRWAADFETAPLSRTLAPAADGFPQRQGQGLPYSAGRCAISLSAPCAPHLASPLAAQQGDLSSAAGGDPGALSPRRRRRSHRGRPAAPARRPAALPGALEAGSLPHEPRRGPPLNLPPRRPRPRPRRQARRLPCPRPPRQEARSLRPLPRGAPPLFSPSPIDPAALALPCASSSADGPPSLLPPPRLRLRPRSSPRAGSPRRRTPPSAPGSPSAGPPTSSQRWRCDPLPSFPAPPL